MRYEGRVFRPPSEGASLIIQATVGCPHNRCAFCAMYSTIRFKVRPVEQIIEDLDSAVEAYGDGVRTIFLADGNCAALPTATLLTIAREASARFPRLERITTYGSAKFLRRKSQAEWRELAAAGLTRVHSGLESGDAMTLDELHKGVSPDDAVAAYRHVIDAGIDLSLYIMVGVAGRERWQEHADASAAVINRVNPRFVRLRTFVPIPGTEWHERWARGELTLLSAHQAVAETRRLVEQLRGPTRLLSDHLSNFVNVHGDIPADQEAILATLDEASQWPQERFRPPTERLIGMLL